MIQGTASQQQTGMVSTISHHTQAGLDSSGGLIVRLEQLRAKLNGQVSAPEPSTTDIPKGVLQVASTVYSNMTVAHKILDEIEQLIG